MIAEVISVGAELLAGETVDTNAPAASTALAEVGIQCVYRQTVGDHVGHIADALRLALTRSQVIIFIGGLGPTTDDLTRDGIAAGLGTTLQLDNAMAESIRGMFETRKLRWVESNRVQAMRPEGAEFLENPRGTAPGLWITRGETCIAALPGPPREFNPMLHNELIPRLRERSSGTVLRSKTLRICGLGESRVAEIVGDLITDEFPTVAPYAKVGDVHLRITSRASSEEVAGKEIADREQALRGLLGWHVYGSDQLTLAGAVLDVLIARGQSLSVAESCSGGQLASLLTDVPGSSKAFAGGAVTYWYSAKEDILEVPQPLLETHGAVSESVARAMALGAKKRFETDFAISITGVAGPGPDDRSVPEGTVFIGLALPNGERVQEYSLGTGRSSIKMRAALAGLTMLWKELAEGH